MRRLLIGIGKTGLHLYTDISELAHSVEELLEQAVERADLWHDTINGAQRTKHAGELVYPSAVVFGEEATTHQGRTAGLYFEEAVEAGRSATESVQEIHAQGRLAFMHVDQRWRRGQRADGCCPRRQLALISVLDARRSLERSLVPPPVRGAFEEAA